MPLVQFFVPWLIFSIQFNVSFFSCSLAVYLIRTPSHHFLQRICIDLYSTLNNESQWFNPLLKNLSNQNKHFSKNRRLIVSKSYLYLLKLVNAVITDKRNIKKILYNLNRIFILYRKWLICKKCTKIKNCRKYLNHYQINRKFLLEVGEASHFISQNIKFTFKIVD